MSVTYDIRIVSAADVPIRTFGSMDQAEAWAAKEGRHWPGARIQTITTTVRVEEIDVAQFYRKTRLRRVV